MRTNDKVKYCCAMVTRGGEFAACGKPRTRPLFCDEHLNEKESNRRWVELVEENERRAAEAKKE
jgi:hypothetical protein